MQLNLDFSRKENSPESTRILRDNEKRFSYQCHVLYDALERGEVLTVYECIVKYGIGDPRRRFKDLRDAGIEIKSELIEGRFKKYYK